MHFSTLLSAATLANIALSSHISGSIHKHGHAAQLHKRAGEVITTGASGLGDDTVHSRLEINDLSSNRPDMWSLYIRAMAQWKSADKTDDTGYFGVSSIHGVPRASWNGVEACDTCDGADGYCTHDSVLFPAWHRAYLALYEQELIKVALEVANTFDGDFGVRMKAAAQKLRIPYWDWAATPDADSTALPTAISAQQVTIEGPNGNETVDNPLFSYHFEDPSDMYYSPFMTWPDTLRYPNSNDASATSQESQAVSAFSNIQGNMQDQVYQLLTACQDYLGFATDDASDNACANSLEGIHNTIHTTSGGAASASVSGGHMTYLPLASFDPIFWIHHANVDRLFALWQTANPASYGASQTAPHSTWTIASGSTQDADSPLQPFRKSANAYWTTNDVKDFEAVFKYSYPEFVVGDRSQATILNYINQFYSATANQTSSSLSARAELSNITTNNTVSPARGVTPSGYASGSASAPYPIVTGAWNGTKASGSSAANGTVSPSSGSTIDPAFIAPNGSVYQYQCNIQTPRYAFNGSYIVYVFDGQPSSQDVSTWLADPNCIGQIGILAGGAMANMNILSRGSVPVTRHLQKMYKAGKLSALSEDVVVPYMTQNLNWKIVYRGEEIQPEALTGYKASFLSGLLSPVMDSVLPSWSNLIPQVDVTRGKAGGITEIVDDVVGGVVSGVGSLVGGLLGGGSPASTAFGFASNAAPATTAAPAPSAWAYPDEEEVTTTVYETHYVTNCPTLSTVAVPDATAIAQAY